MFIALARSRAAEAAVLLLAVVILFGQLGNEVLYSTDGVVYAVVGQELAERPVWQWANLTWLGGPFYEHPPLTPWLLALSFRLFGESTLSALVVPTALSAWTVAMAMTLGGHLKDRAAGLLVGLVLASSPQFVKAGRNPMLEPALQAMITLSVLWFLRARRNSLTFMFLSGLVLGLAWMAKGPPAFLTVPVSIVVAWCISSRTEAPSASNDRRANLFWPVYVAGAVLPAILFELWRASLGLSSFWMTYASTQLRSTVIEGRLDPDFQWTMYLRILLVDFQPWIAVVLVAVPVLLWKEERSLKPLWLTGWVWVLATLVPFTLMRHKSPWYINIYYPGLALIAASLLHFVVGVERTMKWIPRAAAGVGLIVLAAQLALPSLFTGYSRPNEWFLDGAKTTLGRQLEGAAVANCMPLDPWKAPFLYRFYLRAEVRPCDDKSARYSVVATGDESAVLGERLLFAREPWRLVDRDPRGSPSP